MKKAAPGLPRNCLPTGYSQSGAESFHGADALSTVWISRGEATVVPRKRDGDGLQAKAAEVLKRIKALLK
jgi:hypothetical protein